jgi:hypothetical protein
MSANRSRSVAKRARALAAAVFVALPLAPSGANRPVHEHGAHEIPAWVKHRVELQLGERSGEAQESFNPDREQDS